MFDYKKIFNLDFFIFYLRNSFSFYYFDMNLLKLFLNVTARPLTVIWLARGLDFSSTFNMCLAGSLKI